MIIIGLTLRLPRYLHKNEHVNQLHQNKRHPPNPNLPPQKKHNNNNNNKIKNKKSIYLYLYIIKNHVSCQRVRYLVCVTKSLMLHCPYHLQTSHPSLMMADSSLTRIWELTLWVNSDLARLLLAVKSDSSCADPSEHWAGDRRLGLMMFRRLRALSAS